MRTAATRPSSPKNIERLSLRPVSRGAKAVPGRLAELAKLEEPHAYHRMAHPRHVVPDEDDPRRIECPKPILISVRPP
jgi:hypothetical protein